MRAISVLAAACALLSSAVGVAASGSTTWVTFEVRGMKKTASGAT